MVEDSKFSNTILTNIGHQMLTSISNGNRKITYTKAEAYAQDVSSISNETLQALTSLQGKKLSANLLVSNDSGNVVTITANFRNKGLTNDVVFNSIGWFAKLDTDDAERGITANQEYLIGITPASGTQTLVAPPADQSSSQAISINLNMTLSDASNVNMTVSDAGAVHFNQLDDQLAKYTTTADLTKLLAGKADVGSSYTKAEIDAKLLDLTTDTDGKVSADQVQALISDKANISDVYSKSQVDSALSTRDTEISTKANISDVYTKSQVDSALSTRDTQISTKANISDVYTKSDVDNAFTDVRGRLGKLEGTQTLDSPDFNSITTTGVYYITNNTPANIKNNPSSQWGVLVVSNGNGNRTSQVYYPDDGSPQWCRLLNGSNWLPWYQLSTKKDIIKLQNAVNSKADKSQVNVGGNLFRMVSAGNTWNDILGFDNGDASALVAFRGNTGGAMNNLLGNYSAGVAFGGGDTKGFLEVSYGDHNARIGGGNGSAPVWHEDIAWKSDITNLQNKLAQYTVDYNNNYVHDTTIDFNSYLHETRTIKVANVKANNGPLPNTATIWGWFTTYHWDDNSVTQEYRDAGGEVFWRATNASASRQWTWHKYAKQEDIDNQQRQINDLINNINYIKDNYVEGRRFPASQEAQAEAWENENPQRIAFITK